jgi:hypothetical protein
MLRTEGVAPLYRGVLGRVLWLAPGTGITISVFGFVSNKLERGAAAGGGAEQQ